MVLMGTLATTKFRVNVCMLLHSCGESAAVQGHTEEVRNQAHGLAGTGTANENLAYALYGRRTLGAPKDGHFQTNSFLTRRLLALETKRNRLILDFCATCA